MRVGFIGLGKMGSRMAENVRRAGFGLAVWNRSAEATIPFRDRGIHVADSPAELAAVSDVVVVMVSDGAAVKEVLFGEGGVIRGLSTAPKPPLTPPEQPGVRFQPREGLVVLNMSTIAPHESAGVSEMLAAKGVRYVEAPVAGSIKAAEARKLHVYAGGPDGIVTTLRPLLESMGERVTHAGPVGAATTLKAIVNLQLAAQVAALGEGLAMAERAGLDLELVADELLAGGVASEALRTKARKMLQGDFEPYFTTRLMAKDLAIVGVTASNLDLDAPVARAARAIYEVAAEEAHAEDDFSSVLDAYRASHAGETAEHPAAGMPQPK